MYPGDYFCYLSSYNLNEQHRLIRQTSNSRTSMRYPHLKIFTAHDPFSSPPAISILPFPLPDQNHQPITLPTRQRIKHIVHRVDIPLPHGIVQFHLPPKPAKHVRHHGQKLRFRQLHANALPAAAAEGDDVFEWWGGALPAGGIAFLVW